MQERLTKLTDDVIKKLKNAGFIVQRYDSYTTGSIYLKLDWGANNSIRISDHKGKKHLKYKYNLIVNGSQKGWKKESGIWRAYYTEKLVDKMIEEIISSKDHKINKIGSAYYEKEIEENKASSQYKKGFWQKAVLV